VGGDGVENGALVAAVAGAEMWVVAEVKVVTGKDDYWNLVMAVTTAAAALLLVLTPEPQHGVLNLQCQLTAAGPVELFSADA
jgi:hypothetical protein